MGCGEGGRNPRLRNQSQSQSHSRVFGLLALDLFMVHGKNRAFRTCKALVWRLVWIAVALLFNGLVCLQFGTELGLEFLTGYFIEKALAGTPRHGLASCRLPRASEIPARRTATGAGIRGHKDVGCISLQNSYLSLTRSGRRSSRWLSDSIACPPKLITTPWFEFLAAQSS